MNMLTDFGKIKIGEKGEGSGKPKKLDYFKVINLKGEDYREVISAYPPKPKELVVMLPYDKIEDNFNAFMAAYRPSDIFDKCVGRDGKAIRKWKTLAELRKHKHFDGIMEKFGKDGKLPEQIECPEMDCPFAKIKYGPDGKILPSQCKMHCKVAFSIMNPDATNTTPEVPETIPNVVGGIFRLRTTGFYTVGSLINSASMIQQRTFKNNLAGIPLRLKLEFMKAGNNFDVPRLLLTSLGSDRDLYELSEKLERTGRRIVFNRTSMSIEDEIVDIINSEDHEETQRVADEFHPTNSDRPVFEDVTESSAKKSMNLATDPLGTAVAAEVAKLPVEKVEVPAEVKEEVKAAVVTETAPDPEEHPDETAAQEPTEPPKRRGRPAKAPEPPPAPPALVEPVATPPVDDDIPF